MNTTISALQKPTTQCANGVPHRQTADAERSGEDNERVGEVEAHRIGGGDEIAAVAHADEAKFLLEQDECDADGEAGERADEGDETAFGDKNGAHPRSGHAEVAECAHVVPLFEDTMESEETTLKVARRMMKVRKR